MRLLALVPPAAVALALLPGCGGSGTRAASAGGGATPTARPVAYDPRRGPLGCITGHGIQARLQGVNEIQVGPGGSGPLVRFAATPAAATDLQLRGQVQAAEVIGSALLYVRDAPDRELGPIESCLAAIAKG